MLAIVLAVTLATMVAPGAAPAATAAPAPVALAQPSVVVNGVLFRAVEFDTATAAWRNIAVTVTTDRIAAWRALTTETKNAYAAQLIESYRTGLHFAGDIKLSFIDEHNATLDQYLWVRPAHDKK